MIEARHSGELREAARQRDWGWGVGDGGGGRNHSFYMLSGFNLVRAITLQFTEVANQMSVCMCALGVCGTFVFPTCLMAKSCSSAAAGTI